MKRCPVCGCAFTLIPRWAKARWKDDVEQPAKLYLLGKASFLKTSAVAMVAYVWLYNKVSNPYVQFAGIESSV